MGDLLKQSVRLTLILSGIIFLFCAFLYQFRFASGILVGAIWSILNFVFTFNLLSIAILKQSKARLWLLLVVKFPLLYVIGFLILVSRFYPVVSLCTGLSLMLVSIGITKVFQRDVGADLRVRPDNSKGPTHGSAPTEG